LLTYHFENFAKISSYFYFNYEVSLKIFKWNSNKSQCGTTTEFFNYTIHSSSILKFSKLLHNWSENDIFTKFLIDKLMMKNINKIINKWERKMIYLYENKNSLSTEQFKIIKISCTFIFVRQMVSTRCNRAEPSKSYRGPLILLPFANSCLSPTMSPLLLYSWLCTGAETWRIISYSSQMRFHWKINTYTEKEIKAKETIFMTYFIFVWDLFVWD